MSRTGIPEDSVRLAEQLLQVIKSLVEPRDTGNHGSGIDPLAAWNAKVQIQNICDMILQSTMGSLEYTVLLAESCQESQALHFVAAIGIADFIGDGEEALAALSEKAGVHSQFLGVAMSCLLGRGYFEEVGHFGSRVYRNNELSQVLKENDPLSLKAAVGFIGDEGFRATSRLLDAAKAIPNATSESNSDLHPPISSPKKILPAGNIAFGFSGTVFDWMSSPEQAWRAERLGNAMQQLDRMANIHAWEDYPWQEIASPVVDVGGGIGSLEMSLVKHERYNHLEFFIFDLPKTVAIARQVWRIQSITASRISFVPGSFMAPTLAESNIPQGKPTYIIRHVLHDWTDDEVVSILRIVREAMLCSLPLSTGPPRLLVIEMLLQPTSSRFLRSMSMHLLALNNGQTRTQKEMEELIHKAGFKVQGVTHMRALDSIIESVIDE